MAGRSAIFLACVFAVVALQSADGFNEQRLPQKRFMFLSAMKEMAKGMATGMKDMAVGMKDVAKGMGKAGLTMVGGGAAGMTNVAQALANAMRGKCVLFCKDKNSNSQTTGTVANPKPVKPVEVKPPPVAAKTSCQDRPGIDCGLTDICEKSLAASYCAKTCKLC